MFKLLLSSAYTKPLTPPQQRAGWGCTGGWEVTHLGQLTPAGPRGVPHHVVSCSPTKLGGRLARSCCWRTGQASPHWWAIVLICITPSCVLFLSLCPLPLHHLFFFCSDRDCSDGVWHRKLDPHCLRQGRWEYHSLRGPVTLKDRQLFVLPMINFIPYGVRMTFNFFGIKICANMGSNLHIQCDIYFYIHSKYERILMYWSGHFHLII